MTDLLKGAEGARFPPVGAGNADFQVRRLSGYDAAYAGDFIYCWEATTNR